ncbi:ABC transporter substrate-binding protein [Salinarimonas soli]|uniref:Extracellular solute-binding protein n=1 Tax=Salinarimonas soli TaxID=1638099 RepID=A0A5B2W1Z2_9HYPH|nr:extracellular solute-binding protein [Salinarimonas soli]KAA2244239.1 extracellular solute-binding protein [Salinarimonas soli]
MIRTILAAASLSLLMSAGAQAACAFRNEVPLKSLTGSFEAWKAVTGAMNECGNVQAELDANFRQKQPPAFAANPSLYHIGGVANGTLTPLMNAGTIRPLDDLVAKYGQNLSPNQLIRNDGRIMAVAMMVNSQHLMYREDILQELGIPAPKTWDDVLAAAEKIKASGKLQYPLSGTYKAGLDLALEFINMYLGFGGQFTKADNTPAVNSEAGLKSLAMLKRISGYMDPEYLVADSTYVQKQFQQGKIAMANLWASRAAALDDPKESQVVGKVAMAAAPLAMAGGKPATTMWWDGIVVAKNIKDAEAEAAFRVAMEGIDTEMVKANNDTAVWLIKGFEPGRFAKGVVASAMGGAPNYPSTTAMGLMQTALGERLPDFMTGKATAEQTLAAIEASYLARAREQGLVR